MTLTAWRRRARGGSDQGFSLVEVLVSVVLLGLAGTAVLGATAAATRGSADHRKIANAQIWLASAADRISAPVEALPTCDAAKGQYESEVASADRPPGFESAELVVGPVVSLTIDGTVAGSCIGGHPLHLVTLRVRAADGTSIRELQVVKSAVPTAVQQTDPGGPGDSGPPPNTVVPPAPTAAKKCTLDLAVAASVATPVRLDQSSPASQLLTGFQLDLNVSTHIGLGLLGNPLLAVTVCAGAQVVYNTGLTQVARTFPAFTNGFRCRLDLSVIPTLNGVFDGLCTGLQGVLNPVLGLISLLGISLDIFLTASTALAIPATPAEPWTSGAHSMLVLDSTLNQLKLLEVSVL